jgi:hypothetical protein
LPRGAAQLNVRELWDTVVLRDVLGYTLPGVVTLLALALPWLVGVGSESNSCWSQALSVWRNFRWIIVAAVLVLGFVIGHVQIRIIRCFEPIIPAWDLGRLTLSFLADEDEKMQGAFCEAALELFDRDGELRRGLRECRCPPGSERDRDDARHFARTLWRLCDYYVLVRDRNSHATYMGRYYVLAILFSNLGLSAIFLAFCVAAVVSLSLRQWLGVLLTAAVPSIVFLLVFRLLRRCADNVEARTRRERWVRGLDTSMTALVLVALLCTSWFPRQLLPSALLLLALVLIYWSGRFRDQFIRRAFPIFYVLRESTVEPAGEGATPGWGACLSAGIGGVILGYLLRGHR